MIANIHPKYHTKYAQGAASIKTLCANVDIPYETGSDSEIILQGDEIINVDREVLIVHYMHEEVEFEVLPIAQLQMNYESTPVR